MHERCSPEDAFDLDDCRAGMTCLLQALRPAYLQAYAACTGALACDSGPGNGCQDAAGGALAGSEHRP